MKVFTLMHPLSAERAVLNGKLLLLQKVTDEKNSIRGSLEVGHRVAFINALDRKPLFITTPLVKPLLKEEDGSYSFETDSGVIYRLIDIRDLIPTEEAPNIEAEDLILSQQDQKAKLIGKNGYVEHRFKFARPITKDDFIHMCTHRGYRMKLEYMWHEDHTEIDSNDDGTEWSYRWIRVYVN